MTTPDQLLDALDALEHADPKPRCEPSFVAGYTAGVERCERLGYMQAWYWGLGCGLMVGMALLSVALWLGLNAGRAQMERETLAKTLQVRR